MKNGSHLGKKSRGLSTISDQHSRQKYYVTLAFYFSLRRTFYPEYTLRPCAVLCQKGHRVWNSGSTFHQFWVKEKKKGEKQRIILSLSARWVTQDFLICSVHFPSLLLKLPQSICNNCVGIVLLDSYKVYLLFSYLWLITSTFPYCSIHSWPTMMLWTQHVGFVHV